MADSNLPRQDFAPPWLKFPSETAKSANQKSNSYQGDRNRPRREDPYYSRSDFNRLHRQNSFDFHEGKRYPPGPSKYRHHSVDDDYGGYSYGYGYYPSTYNYEKYGMHFSSQPSLARSGSRDGKYPPPARLNQMNGNALLNGPHDLFEPYYQQGSRRGYQDRDSHREVRNGDTKDKDKASEKDRPFNDDFPSLNGSGESSVDSKAKPASGVWENPPKSSNKNEESTDLLKNTSPGIYKALVPSKSVQPKKSVKDVPRVNGSVREISPLSPSNKAGHREGSRYSPTPDLAIVTQPKKLGDKKSDFLRAIRNESSIRNGEMCQNQNQNVDRKSELKQDSNDNNVSDESQSYNHINGDRHVDTNENLVNMKKGVNGEVKDEFINGDALINHVDHITLSGEEEERRLLLSMGWVEEDNTEYEITEDEIREFQNLLQNHCHGQKNGLKSSLRSALDRKSGTDGMLNGISSAEEKLDNKLL